MVQPEAIRARCSGFPGAEERFPFAAYPDLSVFCVFRKWFAIGDLLAASPSITVKNDPIKAEFLRSMFPGITAGYHMNKAHWSTVRLDGSVPDDVVHEMLEDAHELIVSRLPKLQRLALGERVLDEAAERRPSPEVP